VSGYQKLQVTA